MRITRQRAVILEELGKLFTHPKAEEVYEIVRKNMPRISLGTVYRNLEFLSKIGEIQKLELGGAIKRFDANAKNHYHIRCTNCEKIEDAPMPVIKDIEDGLKDKTSFQITGHRLEFLGICKKCLGTLKKKKV